MLFLHPFLVVKNTNHTFGYPSCIYDHWIISTSPRTIPPCNQVATQTSSTVIAWIIVLRSVARHWPRDTCIILGPLLGRELCHANRAIRCKSAVVSGGEVWTCCIMPHLFDIMIVFLLLLLWLLLAIMTLVVIYMCNINSHNCPHCFCFLCLW